MKIIINSSSMVPIYEQIVDQVKAQIISGELKEDDNLPSVRTLSKELRISALTVKKAYDSLEQEGFTVTIHGKGTYVAAANKEMMMEEYRREVEEELTEVIRKAKRYGLSEFYTGLLTGSQTGMYYRTDRTEWSREVHDI